MRLISPKGAFKRKENVQQTRKLHKETKVEMRGVKWPTRKQAVNTLCWSSAFPPAWRYFLGALMVVFAIYWENSRAVKYDKAKVQAGRNW